MDYFGFLLIFSGIIIILYSFIIGRHGFDINFQTDSQSDDEEKQELNDDNEYDASNDDEDFKMLLKGSKNFVITIGAVLIIVGIVLLII